MVFSVFVSVPVRFTVVTKFPSWNFIEPRYVCKGGIRAQCNNADLLLF